ncbi:MAG TPA: M50 family metallopeptidase [Anaerolineales bacterium]|nr:M50 family metallopeptidase [Anaerolineales bacterium]
MNETLLIWIVFILAFGGMVLIHEFGHYIVARLCKIEVEEFGIGLPTPGALTLFTWQGTRFTLNWLPLGGFVRPKGENDPNVPGGLAAASPWKRLAVLVAGPFMNLLTAVVIYSIIFAQVGVPDGNRVLISSVVPEGPAAQAGLQAGDILISGNGRRIHNYDELRSIVDANEDKPVIFLVDRSGEQVQFTVTPRMNDDENRIMIGVGLGNPITPATSLSQPLSFGARYAYYNVRLLISLPAQIIRGALPAEQARLVGLKGIFDIMEQSVASDMEARETPASSPTSDPFERFRTLLLVASLSISLGIFNLFPFPALDGGRILFVLPELIFRRRVPHQLENLVHGMGMALLLLVMIYVNVMDFVNPINFTIP